MGKQIRSFSFCRAERIANGRLHRLEELSAVLARISDEDGIKEYIKLKKEIIGSHSIEADKSSEEYKKIKKEDMIEHNKKASRKFLSSIK